MATIVQEPKTTLPPGPTPLPVIGNALSFRTDPLGFFQQLQRTYGNMATVYLGRVPIVLLFQPEHVRYLLIEHPRIFNNREFTQGSGGNSDGVLDEGLLTIDGEAHRQQRRAVQPAFHKKRVEGYADSMLQYSQELLKTWHAGDVVDVSRAMQELTLRIVGKCLFNIDLNRQLSDLGTAFNGIIGTQPGILETLLNIRIDQPFTAYGKRLAAIRRLDTLIYTLIAQRRGDEHDRGDVLSMLLTAPDARDVEHAEVPLSDKQVHDHIMTFIAAGHETTANALTWTFYLLSEHPEVREKLLNEMHTILNGRTPTIEDMANMPYLDWVLSESMRLYPPAWIQGRSATEAFELDGVQFPAGTLFLLSQWVTHRMPSIWGDPEAFRPERWDPVNGQKVPQGAYFPFGAGPRICIGMPFAQIEAKLILITLLQKYTPRTTPGYRPGISPLITLRPKENLRMTLLPTSTQSSAAPAWEQVLRVPYASQNEPANRRGCRNAFAGIFDLLQL